MSYEGDLEVGAVLDFTFTTVNSTGAPTTLLGTPVISIYKANSITQSTTGITLAVDFDGITGLNHIQVNIADAFYAANNDYSVIITTGTVDGVSVVGYTVGSFSIENRAAKTPDKILDASNGVETNFTLREALRIILSASAGKVSGSPSPTITIRDINDTTDRIVALTDSDGNRTLIVLDVT